MSEPAEQLVPDDWFWAEALAGGVPAEQLVPDDWFWAEALAGGVPAEELVCDNTPAPPVGLAHFEMRGIDSGTSTYTTWVATAADPNGAQATPANTTPALVGAIVAGSGYILASW